MRRLLSLGLTLAGLWLGSPIAIAQTIEITAVLRDLHASDLDDGVADSTVEAYGFVNVDGVRVEWNDGPCKAGGCLGVSETTDIAGGRYQWKNMYLRHSGSSMRRNNNIIVLRRAGADIARPFTIAFSFRDHDERSQDDWWCESHGDVQIVAGGRGVAEWLGPARSHRVSGDQADGKCVVTIQLFGKLISLH
jgi:hypothetical protein